MKSPPVVSSVAWSLLCLALGCQTSPPITAPPASGLAEPASEPGSEAPAPESIEDAPGAPFEPPPPALIAPGSLPPWEAGGGCLGIRPDGRAAVLVVREMGVDADGEWGITLNVEAVALPGVDVSAIHGVSLFCNLEGVDREKTDLDAHCAPQFAGFWDEDKTDLLDMLARENWLGCRPLAAHEGWAEARLGGARVALKTYGKILIPKGILVADAGPGRMAGAWQSPVDGTVFASFETEDIVTGEGSTGHLAILTPEELGVPRCVPAADAPALFAPASSEPADPNGFDGCLGVTKDGRHALFGLIDVEEGGPDAGWDEAGGDEGVEGDGFEGDGDGPGGDRLEAGVRYVWAGPDPGAQPPIPTTGRGLKALIETLSACAPIEPDERGDTVLLDGQGRLWIKVPGHAPRWLWTNPYGDFDGPVEESVAEVLIGPTGTHLFLDIYHTEAGPGSQSEVSSVLWRSLQTTGLAVCAEPR